MKRELALIRCIFQTQQHNHTKNNDAFNTQYNSLKNHHVLHFHYVWAVALNGKGFRCGYDVFTDSIIKMSMHKSCDTKWQDATVIITAAIHNCSLLMPYCPIWQLKTKLSLLHVAHEQYDAINKPESQTINTRERHACIYADFISISVKMEGTSSSIPCRLNNSGWNTSFQHITKKKKLCAAWVFVWEVERKKRSFLSRWMLGNY